MKQPTPLRSIRAKCLDCCGDSKSDVRLCDDRECPLYCYRLGKTGRKRSGNPNAILAMKAARRMKTSLIKEKSEQGSDA